MSVLGEAVDLAARRIQDSRYEADGNTAKLTIKWQKDDGPATEGFFAGPIFFQKNEEAWKIVELGAGHNPFANGPNDPSGMADGLKKVLILIKSTVNEFQKGNIQTSEQLRAALNEPPSTGPIQRKIRFDEFTVIYHYTNKERTKAYLCFSLPGYIVTGMIFGRMLDRETSEGSVTIEIGAVPDTEANRQACAAAKMKNITRTNDLWIWECDIGGGLQGKPAGGFKMYYRNPQGPQIEIPLRGTPMGSDMGSDL